MVVKFFTHVFLDLPQTLELVLQVVTLFYGGNLVIRDEMTGGELVSLLLYQVSLSAAIDVSHLILELCF